MAPAALIASNVRNGGKWALRIARSSTDGIAFTLSETITAVRLGTGNFRCAAADPFCNPAHPPGFNGDSFLVRRRPRSPFGSSVRRPGMCMEKPSARPFLEHKRAHKKMVPLHHANDPPFRVSSSRWIINCSTRARATRSPDAPTILGSANAEFAVEGHFAFSPLLPGAAALPNSARMSRANGTQIRDFGVVGNDVLAEGSVCHSSHDQRTSWADRSSQLKAMLIGPSLLIE